MVNFLTRLKITDNTGVLEVQCIKILGGSLMKRAKIGFLVVVVIKHTLSKLKKYSLGRIYKALIIRTTFSFFRAFGVWIRFGHNAAILVNKRNAPFAKRISGPMLKEICIRFNFLGIVSRFII